MSLINKIFPMQEYVIPEGMKLWKESCFVNVFKITSGKLPSYDCTPVFVPEDFTRIVSESSLNVSLETLGISLLFIFAIGLFGATIVELLYNKLDWYLTPLTNLVEKRYRLSVKIRRLNTMNGHP